MGKYMRKAKIAGDFAVMDVSQSTLGVRTRAKTLALQSLHATTTAPPPNPDSSYLQLRSRRLEKPPLMTKKPQQSAHKECCRRNSGANSCVNPSPSPSSRLRVSCADSDSVGSGSIGFSNQEEGFCGQSPIVAGKEEGAEEAKGNCDLGVEASFGENNLEHEGRERITRESTPCSLIRDSEMFGTPGSSTRPASLNAANRRIRSAVLRNIPTTQEMEEFFATAEREQQRLFTEKYNFDVANDMPLPGRYEWVRV
ncbi:hypothetical protein RJ639_046386 [Escallonia herrerae]|uniref:Cyclin-dependent kinase inhibitor domain-containing protein n=1 Tax=Escallonia herrerae TaxID=1293975 RepID=A0AA89B1K6_9ASTE|nr:hypothetical protein RJ639_046386 [Escallonia herrerae]